MNRLLRRTRRHLWWQACRQRLSRALPIAAALACAGVVLQRQLPAAPPAALVTASLAPVVLALLLALRRDRPSLTAAALAADRQNGTRELLTTAWELSASQAAAPSAVAATILQRARMAAAAAPRPAGGGRLDLISLLALLVLAGAVLILSAAPAARDDPAPAVGPGLPVTTDVPAPDWLADLTGSQRLPEPPPQSQQPPPATDSPEAAGTAPGGSRQTSIPEEAGPLDQEPPTARPVDDTNRTSAKVAGAGDAATDLPPGSTAAQPGQSSAPGLDADRYAINRQHPGAGQMVAAGIDPAAQSDAGVDGAPASRGLPPAKATAPTARLLLDSPGPLRQRLAARYFEEANP